MDDFGLSRELENDSRCFHLPGNHTGVGDATESYTVPVDGASLLNHAPDFEIPTSPAFTDYTPNRRNVYLMNPRALPAHGEAHHQLLGSSSHEPLHASSNSNNFNSQQSYLRPTSGAKLNNLNDVAGRPQTRRDSDMPIDGLNAGGDESLYWAQDNSFTENANIAGTRPTIHCTSEPKLVQRRKSRLSSYGVPSSSKENRGKPEHGSRETSGCLDNSQEVYLTVSFDSATSAATCPISCETRLSMILYGEVIMYDLKGLDSNPRVITELLKVTQSERANYMVVAAFYRRVGNPQSAKAVILSMIDEFTNRSVEVKELKPAFLMLSGCESDMAKMAQESNKDPPVVAGYHAAAQAWLHKVFGAAESQYDEKEKPKGQGLAKCPLPTQPRAFGNSRPGSCFDAEKSKMEREIQTLRSRTANLVSQLFELRGSKRKLEEDIVHERNLRRRLQRELENTIKERDAGLKMERYALIQVKREVASRRNAEARLGALLNDKESA